jgi:hypothetical protein
VLDLVGDDAFHRVAVLANFASRREGLIEIRADQRSRPRLRQLMAGSAFLDEEHAPTGTVRTLGPTADTGDAEDEGQECDSPKPVPGTVHV